MDYITDHTAKKYLIENYEWYDKKAISNKRLYTCLTVSSIITSAVIPFITLFMDAYPITKYIVAFIGSISSIIAALNAKFRFHERWIEYRSTAERLKYIKYLFETKSFKYKAENRAELLLSDVDSIVGRENKRWRSIESNNKETAPEKKGQ